MDLINITSYLWNIFLLFLFFLSGTILERTNRTRGTRKSLQLDFKDINSMETIQKMSSTSSTLPTVLALTATPTNTILLSSLTRTTAPTTPPTTKSIKLVSFEQNAKNNKAKQEKQQNQYKRPKKMRRNMKATTADNSHEIFNSNMTTALAVTIATQTVDEHGKQEKQTKSFAVLATDSKSEMYNAQEHFLPITLHDSINSLRDIKKILPSLESPQRVEAQKEMLGSLKLTKMNLQNALATTSKPFLNFYKDQHTSNRSSINELYINDPGVYGNNSRNIMHRNNYDGNGQAANTLSTATITINSFNKSNQAIIVSATTRKPIALATKQNHMYDNNMALSYLPYKSAALKASASDMKTLNNNKNMYSSSSSISRVSSSLKRDTLMSLAGIITTAKAAVVDNSFMKNSSNTHVQDTDDEENVLKIQYNFKSNNSLAHEALAMKQTSQTTVKASTSTTLTIAINETSSSSSSSLPFNVSSTYSGISTAATTKESPTATKPNSSTTTSTSRTTLKSTTRRRKKATTTLKPPPTIDDYQTTTSQAGTHAYLPCNVKQLVKKPISWLRVRDGHILTVDQTTFIADQRFQSIYTTNPERWSLQIKYVQLKDAGIYECQVSTEPKASAIVYLHVVEPKTELIGAPTRHVKAGSQVKLLCIISQALEPPLFINWFYNQKQIYLHNRKGWHTEIERIELPPETTTSTTTTTTTTTSTTTTPPTTSVPLTAATSSTLVPPLLPSKLSSTSSSMFNGSEISAMHVFTSAAPQQSLNDGNLLELVSESTNNNYPNLIQPAAASISTALKTQQTHPSTTTTTTASAKTTTLLAESTVSATSSIESSTLPGALSAITTTLSFDDTDDSNDDENDDEDDFKTNPTASTFEAAEAIAAGRGYMMLSSLMTFTDVKQITTASLIIPSVQKQDSGNYTCSPSNSEPRTVILHVLNGEYSASAITSVALNLHVHYKLFILNLSIFTLVNSILKNSLFYKQHTIRRYSGG